MKKIFWTRRNLILIIVAVVVLGLGGYYLYARKFSVMPDATVSLMEDVHEPTASDRVLIFTPHFDDETIAAGGYIQKSIANKATVQIVAVTDGNRRGFGQERKTEFREVAKTLGVNHDDLIFLDLPEFYLKERVSSSQLASDLQAKINAFAPTVIIYPDQSDTNPDHKFIGQTLDETLKNRTDLYAYSYLVHWKYFPQPVGLHPGNNLTPPVKLIDFSHHWQRYFLSQKEEDNKLAALLIYKSQLRTPLLHDLLMSMVRRNELFNEKLRPLPNYK